MITARKLFARGSLDEIWVEGREMIWKYGRFNLLVYVKNVDSRFAYRRMHKGYSLSPCKQTLV
jgi:hypothetical protein